ncbi:MAG: alpha-glucosidase, partial [Bacteroidota bacterium]
RKLDQMQIVIHVKDPSLNLMEVSWKSDPGAAIYGLGEQFSHVDFQGHKVRLIPEENGIGRGDKGVTGIAKLGGAAGDEHTTYCPIPWMMTDKGRGVFVANTAPLHFDFSEKGRVTLQTLGDSLVLEVWQKEKPLDLLEAFSEKNGRFRVLPDWAWGTWLGIQGGPEKCRKAVAEAKAAGNPVTAIWIQDWVGKRKTPYGSRLFWHWEANEDAYPNLKDFIAEMNAQGVHVLGYINPFLAEESALFETARDHLVRDVSGQPLSIPAGGFKAYQFYVGDTAQYLVDLIHRNMIDLGFSGWMADFGEWYPAEAAPIPGRPWLHMHNDYPVQWQATNREALHTHPKGDSLIFFSRSGYRYTGRYAALYWAGDQMTSWGEHDGLPSAVTALISGGLSGIALNHADIGGYTNIHLPILKVTREAELFQRWAEFAAFTPIFRTHEGLQPERNVQPWTNPDIASHFARMGQLHHALRPYLRHLNRQAAQKGWPMVRHLWLHYPDDPEVRHLKSQFLLGEDLLVLPVLEPGTETVRGYFPEGKWAHLLTGAQVDGGQWLEVSAPIGTPAAYVKVGSAWEARLQNAVREALH